LPTSTSANAATTLSQGDNDFSALLTLSLDEELDDELLLLDDEERLLPPNHRARRSQ